MKSQLQTQAGQKVLIYCRVSSTKQTIEGSGLDSQEHRCRQYAAVHGYDVEKVFPDDASGGGDFMNRPGMVALLHYLDQNPHTNYIVLFDDLKRFSRDREFHFKLKNELMARRATIECLNFKFEDTPEGEFIETIFAAQGQLERLQNRRQVVQKMKARIEQGAWVFAPPLGYKYQKQRGHGKVMMRDEPLASCIEQALKGFASDLFSTQVEVQRFLEGQPAFPKDKKGRVHPSRIKEILTQILYSGHVEKKEWNVSLRKGFHEGLITLAEFETIQDKLTKKAKAPARKDISQDFPLRGFILCDDCDRPLTSCWSQGKHKKFPYYRCSNKDCTGQRKSIPRHVLEGEFEELLTQLKPTQGLFDMVSAMFKDAWDQQASYSEEMFKSAKKRLQAVDKKIEKLVDHIMTSTNSAAVNNYEKRIEELEKEKILMQENLVQKPIIQGRFEELFKHTLQFIANPYKMWASGQFKHKRAVLKLAFEERIIYSPKKGLRTPKTTLPFSMLASFSIGNSEMVEPSRVELLTS